MSSLYTSAFNTRGQARTLPLNTLLTNRKHRDLFINAFDDRGKVFTLNIHDYIERLIPKPPPTPVPVDPCIPEDRLVNTYVSQFASLIQQGFYQGGSTLVDGSLDIRLWWIFMPCQGKDPSSVPTFVGVPGGPASDTFGGVFLLGPYSFGLNPQCPTQAAIIPNAAPTNLTSDFNVLLIDIYPGVGYSYIPPENIPLFNATNDNTTRFLLRVLADVVEKIPYVGMNPILLYGASYGTPIILPALSILVTEPGVTGINPTTYAILQQRVNSALGSVPLLSFQIDALSLIEQAREQAVVDKSAYEILVPSIYGPTFPLGTFEEYTSTTPSFGGIIPPTPYGGLRRAVFIVEMLYSIYEADPVGNRIYAEYALQIYFDIRQIIYAYSGYQNGSQSIEDYMEVNEPLPNIPLLLALFAVLNNPRFRANLNVPTPPELPFSYGASIVYDLYTFPSKFGKDYPSQWIIQNATFIPTIVDAGKKVWIEHLQFDGVVPPSTWARTIEPLPWPGFTEILEEPQDIFLIGTSTVGNVTQVRNGLFSHSIGYTLGHRELPIQLKDIIANLTLGTPLNTLDARTRVINSRENPNPPAGGLSLPKGCSLPVLCSSCKK